MLNLIIVEDEIFTAKQIKDAINWNDFNIAVGGVFTNGIKALDYIKEHHTDIVITDIKMPVMDGLTLIEKSKEISKDIQFIIITGHRDFEYARQAIKFGVLDYLLKPLQYKTLTDVLTKATNAVKNVRTIEAVPFQNNQLSVFRQNLFANILCGINTNLPDISHDLSKAKIPEYIMNNACMLINIDFVDFDNFLALRWKYSMTRFKNAVMKIIPFETESLYFIIVNFLFDQLLIFVTSKSVNIDLKYDVDKYMKLISNNMKEILSLDIKYNIISEFNNIEEIFLNIKQQQQINLHEDIIDKCKRYITENLSQQITLTDVADYIHLNPVYFSSYFKNKTGTNFSTYLKDTRIEHAKHLLKNSSISISQICEVTGFKSESYFYKLFKGVNGITPQQYRDQSANESKQKG